MKKYLLSYASNVPLCFIHECNNNNFLNCQQLYNLVINCLQTNSMNNINWTNITKYRTKCVIRLI